MTLSTRVAQKDHKCSVCLRRIPKGHRYWRKDINVDGSVENISKEHTNCELYKNERIM